MSSAINPEHYNKGTIEPWDFIESQKLGFLEGNIIKYIARYKYKNGIEDLEKAKTYLEKLISTFKERNPNNLQELPPQRVFFSKPK